MGGNARKEVAAQSAKYGMKPFLPPAVAFGSHQWPTLITPGTAPPRSTICHNRLENTAINLDTVTALAPSYLAGRDPEWRNGFAWLAGGTWLFSEPQPETDTLIDLGHLGWPRWRLARRAPTSARPAASPSSIASRRGEWVAAPRCAPAATPFSLRSRSGTRPPSGQYLHVASGQADDLAGCSPRGTLQALAA